MATLRETFKNIADAIRDKGVEGTMKPVEMAEKIGEISTGEPIVEYKDVNFFRPDGKLLYSYSKDEVLADGWTMPEQPDWAIEWDVSSGKTSIEMNKDGWNWSLDKVLQCVNAQGVCNIAGDYTPSDGKTHILVNVADTSRPDFSLYYKQSVANGVVVDWGDGTQTSDSSTTASQRNHTYVKGVYHLTVENVNGTIVFGSASSSYNILGSFNVNTRYKCAAVRYIAFGSNIQGTSYLLQYLSQMEHVILSRTFTNITGCSYLCQYCTGLSFLSFPLQNKYQQYSNVCYYCYALQTVVFAQDNINLVSNCFQSNIALKNIVLPITAIFGSSNNFLYCYSITRLFFSVSTSIAYLSSNSCQGCSSLKEFIFDNDIITTIQSYALSNCYSLTKLALPSNLATIQANAFNGNSAMMLYDFRRATKVPTLSGVSAFTSMPSDCKIVVPDALYDTWIAATNWSNSTIVSHIIKASEYED